MPAFKDKCDSYSKSFCDDKICVGCGYFRPKTLKLHLVLKHCFYEQIEDGSKKIEYRDSTEYWRKRILDHWSCNGGNIVTFHKGYTKTTMTFKIELLVVNSVTKKLELHLGDRIN